TCAATSATTRGASSVERAPSRLRSCPRGLEPRRGRRLPDGDAHRAFGGRARSRGGRARGGAEGPSCRDTHGALGAIAVVEHRGRRAYPEGSRGPGSEALPRPADPPDARPGGALSVARA